MKAEEVDIKENGFDFSGTHYDCSRAIKYDIKSIIQEAEATHKEIFDLRYDRNSLRPHCVRLYLLNDKPVYAMIIYTIDSRAGYKRTACGNYYPVEEDHLDPHLYQARICW